MKECQKNNIEPSLMTVLIITLSFLKFNGFKTNVLLVILSLIFYAVDDCTACEFVPMKGAL